MALVFRSERTRDLTHHEFIGAAAWGITGMVLHGVGLFMPCRVLASHLLREHIAGSIGETLPPWKRSMLSYSYSNYTGTADSRSMQRVGFNYRRVYSRLFGLSRCAAEIFFC